MSSKHELLKKPEFFCVVDIGGSLWQALHQPRYLGRSLSQAASALVPGTCHGTGSTEEGACMAAIGARIEAIYRQARLQ